MPEPELSASLIFSRTPLAELVGLARRLEDAGYHRVCFGEAWREPVVPMTATLAATSRIGVGSAISQIYPVNPVVTAQQAAQLQELGAGRFTLGLGLGAGFVVERWFGVPYERPLRRTREFIEVVRGVLGSAEHGPFSYEGEIFRVRKYRLPFAEQAVGVPIHLAAIGPRMQELAGELADGIIVGSLHSPRSMEETKRRIDIGADRADRDPNEVALWYYLTCCVSNDSERARALARRSLVYLTQYPHYRCVYAEEGFGALAERIAGLARERAMERAEAAITDEMIDRFCIAGTVAECRDQLRRYAGYPGSPVLHLVPFRIEEDEVVESFRLAAQLAQAPAGARATT
ncbi:luciferase-like protein [Amycolatopsis methanolica 239]|uniref:Luciferase-like protein n=2 Tax=Amycolatopsis methanolica TaxID=1814 RepID=A0A076MQW6_AMYME|nr:LLM class flavin-dependent oxidoreductase [Amycolatopsis methanolica]AIJ21265.1 luciferase-like protein [Amycolatopsis methanolica 239]